MQSSEDFAQLRRLWYETVKWLFAKNEIKSKWMFSAHFILSSALIYAIENYFQEKYNAFIKARTATQIKVEANLPLR